MIHSHHSLEASAACPASGADARKARHGATGPLRAGNAFHAWAKAYLEHLLRTKQPTDFTEAEAIWGRMRALISPEDEHHVGELPIRTSTSMMFQWLIDAADVAVEVPRWFTMDRRPVPPDRVLDLTAPLLRVTPDLTFRSSDLSMGRLVGGLEFDPDGRKVLHVWDWKTNHIVEHVTLPAENRQLLRYAAALAAPDDDAVVVWLAFPRRGYVEGTVFFREELDRAWADLVVAPVRAIEEGHVGDERVVGPQCLDCRIMSACDAALRFPYVANQIVELSPTDLVVAHGIAKAVLFQIERRVRETVARNGPLAAGSFEAKIIELRKADWSRERVTTELRKHGLSDEQIAVAFAATDAGIRRALSQAQVRDRGKVFAELKAATPSSMSTSLRVGLKRSTRPEVDDDGGEVDYE